MDKELYSYMFMLMPLLNDNYSNSGKTDIKYIIIIGIMCISIISKIFTINDIKNLLKYNENNQYVSIIISSHSVQTAKSFTSTSVVKTVYSDNFLSIIYYLLNTKDIKFNEYLETMTLSKDMEISNCERGDILNQYIFIPICNNKTLIDKINNIYIEIIKIEKDPNDDNDNKDNKNVQSKNIKFKIILSILKNNKNNEQEILYDFLDNCNKKYKIFLTSDNNKHYIYTYKGYDKDNNKMDLYFNKIEMNHNKDLDTNIFFEDKHKLINYINPFIFDYNVNESDGEKTYKKSGFTFKAGILFYGSPGCGKSSTIKGILKKTNRHGIIINLNKIKTCEELERVFYNTVFNKKEYSPKQLCFIIEDCDAFENNFIYSRKLEKPQNKNESINIKDILTSAICTEHKSHNEADNDQVNLSCFLNILDGVIELNGVMIIMTTNHPEKIDEALLRPGRFDFKYEFKKATNNVLKQMLKFKFELSDNELNRYHELDSLKDEVLSPAEIQSICFKNNNIDDCIKDILIAYQK